MTTSDKQTELLNRLHSEFDASFAEPARAGVTRFLEFLGLRIGDADYAIELEQIAAVHELRDVTHVPGHLPGCLGIAAVQSQLVAVYDLAASIAQSGEHRACRWLILSSSERQVGFAVDSVDGFLRVLPEKIVTISERQQSAKVAQRAVDEGSGRIILDLNAMVDAIRTQVDSAMGRQS